MKLTYSFIALVLLMPVCISYAYQSKKHWTQVQSQIQKTDTPPLLPEAILPSNNDVNNTVQPKSYQEVLKISKETNKQILLYFSSEKYCQPCRDMKSTFADPKVQNILNQYVFYTIDMEGPEVVIGQEKGVNQVPTYMVITPMGNIIKRGMGYKNAASFIAWIENRPMALMVYPGRAHPVAHTVRWLISPRYRAFVRSYQYCVFVL